MDRLEGLAKKATEERRWADVETHVRDLTAFEAKTYGPDHPWIANSWIWIASSLDQRRRYAEAEPLYRKALEIYRKKLGEDHPDTTTGYDSLAHNLKTQGRYAEAVATYRRTLEIRRRLFGKSHSDTTDSYINLALSLDAQGRYAEAEPLHRAALENLRGPWCGTGTKTALGYDNLAVNLNAQGRYTEAESLFRKALETRRKLLGVNNIETAASYNNLAVNLNAQGRYAEADPFYRGALDIVRRELGEDDPGTAISYNNVAYNLDAQGHYGDAESLHRNALKIFRKAWGENHPDTALAYNNLAVNLNAQGRYAEAEPLYRKALEIRRKTLGDEHPYTAQSYNNLAGNLDDQSQTAAAEPLHRKALEIYIKALGGDHPDTATSYDSVASNLNAQGRYAEAEPLFRKALESRRKMLGEEHPDTASSDSSLASNLNAQGRYAEAEPLFRKALEIRGRSLGRDHPYTAANYNNLALNLDKQGRHGDAEALYRKALEIHRKALGEAHPDMAVGYNNLALNLNDQSRYAEAEPLAREAMRIARKVRDAAGGAGLSGDDAALARARTSSGEASESLRPIYDTYIEVAYGAASADPTQAAELRAEAFTAAQDYTASAEGAAMALAAARAAAGGGRLGQAVRRQQDLSGQARALDQQQLAALGRGDAAREAAIREQRGKVLAELASLDAEIARDFPGYAQLARPPAVEIAALQQRLGAGEGLMMILPVGEDMFSFAVSKTAVAWNKLADGAGPTADRVATLRAAMGGTVGRRAAEGAADEASKVIRFDRQAAYRLYADLIAPVETALPGVTRLYGVVSGPLSDLPLSVLMTNAPRPGSDDSDEALADPDTPFLSERYALATLPSVSSLGTRGRAADKDGAAKAAPGPSAKPEPFIGYGAPSLLGSTAGAVDNPVAGYQDGKPFASRAWVARFAPLPATGRELDQMATTLKASPDAIHLGPQAREDLLRDDKRLASARVVAFATHGFTRAEAKGLGEPGLILTPPQTPGPNDDGVLTASEASTLTFSADWVILSACDTASPDGSGGQSLSSLARGFLYAGAGGLLASHWPVDDAVTAVLTTETLRLRASGLTRGQALQGAMRAVRTGQRIDGSSLPGWNPHWANPRLWAPFSVITHQDR